VIINLPDTAHDVPDERSVVRFVLVTTAIFQIMSDRRVEVAVHRETLLPVILTVFLSTFLEMLRDFEEHGLYGAVVSNGAEIDQRSI
jgi:hypothetical protein